MKYYLLKPQFEAVNYIQGGTFSEEVANQLFAWPRPEIAFPQGHEVVFQFPRKKFTRLAVLHSFSNWPCWSAALLEILDEFSGNNYQKFPVRLMVGDKPYTEESYYLIVNRCIIDDFIDLEKSDYRLYESGQRPFFQAVFRACLNTALANEAPLVETPEMRSSTAMFVSEPFRNRIESRFSKKELRNVRFLDPDIADELLLAF